MLTSLNQQTADTLANWADYIIVGAGAAGSVIAARLAEDPNNSVLVIELGPDNLGNKWIDTPADNMLLWEHPDGPDPSPTALAFDTAIQKGRTYRYPRGNGLGGSINHHSMVDGRGSAEIYDNIASLVGDPRWSYSNLLPYFRKMETYHPESLLDPDAEVDTEYHGTSGWLNIRHLSMKAPLHLAFLQTASEITGAPIQTDMSGNPENANGVGLVSVQVTNSGQRSYSITDLLVPQMNRGDNLIVLLNTLVTKVLISEGRADGVECLSNPRVYLVDESAPDGSPKNKYPGTFSFRARKEVILSGGAINTPQLLLLSGIGPRNHLEAIGVEVILDRPGVGSDLMDHNEVNVIYDVDPLKMVWPGQAANIIDQIDDILESTDSFESELSNEERRESLRALRRHLSRFADRTEQKQGSGAIILDWFSGLDTDIGHDLHMDCGEGFMFDFNLRSMEPLPDGRQRVDYFRSQYNVDAPDFFRVFHHCLVEVLRPTRAEGTIRLASRDPTVPPVIDLGLWKDDEAVERMAHGIQMFRRIVNDPSLRSYYRLDSDGRPHEVFPGYHVDSIDQLKEYIKRWSAFGHHISGTAKMGRDNNPRAVVDTQLRVWGVPNLRVADTSIYPFPYLHGYNTSRGAYLIGEVAADLIKGSNMM